MRCSLGASGAFAQKLEVLNGAVVFGETGLGSEDGWNPAGYICKSNFQAPDISGASITKLTIYIEPNVVGTNAKMAIYSGDCSVILGETSEVTLNNAGFAWVEFTLTSPVPISANANYWFALAHSDSVWLRCTTTNRVTNVGSNTFVNSPYDANIYNSGFPLPFTVSGGSNTVASLYATLNVSVEPTPTSTSNPTATPVPTPTPFGATPTPEPTTVPQPANYSDVTLFGGCAASVLSGLGLLSFNPKAFGRAKW
jgi:hypothetical protein